MKKAFYHIYTIPLYLMILIPFPVLYMISDFFFFILYYLIGYRKKVVIENLKNSFPEKSEEEINRIMKDFYLFLCDVFLETFKTLTISKKEIIKRCGVAHESLPLLEKLFLENKNFCIVMGHFGNWELGGQAFSAQSKHIVYALYHPLKSKYFDWLMLKMRSHFGMRLIPLNISIKEMVRNKDILSAITFIADQTPSNLNDVHWMNFMNQETPVFLGAEKIAMKFNYPVVYVGVHRVKRGYYKIHFELVTETPQQTAEGFITESHTRLLERDIRNHPEIWLWSHRRWKHKKSDIVND